MLHRLRNRRVLDGNSQRGKWDRNEFALWADEPLFVITARGFIAGTLQLHVKLLDVRARTRAAALDSLSRTVGSLSQLVSVQSPLVPCISCVQSSSAMKCTFHTGFTAFASLFFCIPCQSVRRLAPSTTLVQMMGYCPQE